MPTDEVERVIHLFSQEIPEVGDGSVEIMAVARKPGVRTKVIVQRRVPGVDAVGVCVGVRGCRIRKIVDQLDGERIDLIVWDDSPEKMIATALQPAVIKKVTLYPAQHRAVVVVDEELAPLSYVLRHHNRELASQLCGWELEIET